MPLIELEDVERAARRLAGVAHRTPVLTSRTLDERVGARVHVKGECFQRGGAFKFRGAYNKISSLEADGLRRGVLAYSSGNHAQAVAIAAGLLGTHATIVMPEDAPAAKLDATRGYGAEIVTYDRWAESREELGAALAEERGLELVRPYASHGCDRALELADDFGNRDLRRGACELVPALGAALARDQAAAAELREDALEELRWDLLGGCELFGRREAGRRGRELGHRPQGVIDLRRDPHLVIVA